MLVDLFGLLRQPSDDRGAMVQDFLPQVDPGGADALGMHPNERAPMDPQLAGQFSRGEEIAT